MTSIGEALATARRKQKLTVADVEKATKIRAKYITAMEHDAFDQISSHAYAIGFLRTYAELLKLEPGPLIDECRRLDQAEAIDLRDSAETSGFSGRLVLVSIVGLLLLILSGITLRYIWTIVSFS